MEYKVGVNMNHDTILVINSFRTILPSKKKKGKATKATVSIDIASKVCPKINLPFSNFWFDCTLFMNRARRYDIDIITGIVIGNTKLLSMLRAIYSEEPTIPTIATKNTIFQKLSLLSLEAIKPVCVITEFCSSVFLLCLAVTFCVKSSMKTYCNYWFKTYNSIISNSHHVLKQIIRNIRKFLSKFYKNIVNIASLRYYSGITITYRYRTMRDILLNVRTDTATKELLKEAAAMLGTTVTGFLLSTATKEAHELINNKHHFFLNSEQWNKFCSALDEDPKENKALQKLLGTKGVFDE
jgi:uncharacterized protein (DUF1778 family)